MPVKVNTGAPSDSCAHALWTDRLELWPDREACDGHSRRSSALPHVDEEGSVAAAGARLAPWGVVALGVRRTIEAAPESQVGQAAEPLELRRRVRHVILPVSMSCVQGNAMWP